MEIYNMIFRDEPLHVKVGELYLTVLRRLADLPEAGLGAPRRAARPETEEGGAQSNIYIFSTLWRSGKLNSVIETSEPELYLAESSQKARRQIP